MKVSKKTFHLLLKNEALVCTQCSFKKRTGLDDVNSYVDTPTPDRPLTSQPKRQSKMEKDIRANEQLLLNVWVQENFFIFGGITTFVVLLCILFAAGPPPSDPRCTLPWC